MLTKRGRYKSTDVPLAGIPHHALDTYLERFLKHNMTVAICEQLETPEQAKQRKSNVLRRAVTRVVTPGTLIEERFLDPRAHQFLAAVVAGPQGQVGVAWVDISTGELRLAPSSAAAVASDLGRIQAKEVVMDRATPATLVDALRSHSQQLLVSLVDAARPLALDEAPGAAASVLDEHSLAHQLFESSFACVDRAEFTPLELDAVNLLFHVCRGALLCVEPAPARTNWYGLVRPECRLRHQYVVRTQQGRLPRIQRPVRFLWSSTLRMDASTRYHPDGHRGTWSGLGFSLSFSAKTVFDAVTAAPWSSCSPPRATAAAACSPSSMWP